MLSNIDFNHSKKAAYLIKIEATKSQWGLTR